VTFIAVAVVERSVPDLAQQVGIVAAVGLVTAEAADGAHIPALVAFAQGLVRLMTGEADAWIGIFKQVIMIGGMGVMAGIALPSGERLVLVLVAGCFVGVTLVTFGSRRVDQQFPIGRGMGVMAGAAFTSGHRVMELPAAANLFEKDQVAGGTQFVDRLAQQSGIFCRMGCMTFITLTVSHRLVNMRSLKSFFLMAVVTSR